MDSQTIISNPSSPDGSELSLSMGIPKRGTSDVYILHMMNNLAAHRGLFANLQNTTDVKIVPLTRSVLSSVLDDKVRDDLMKAYSRALSFIQNSSGIDNTEKGALIIEASQLAVAQVYAYLDEFIGLSKINAIIPLTEDPVDDGPNPKFVKSARRHVVTAADDCSIPPGTEVFEQDMGDGDES